MKRALLVLLGITAAAAIGTAQVGSLGGGGLFLEEGLATVANFVGNGGLYAGSNSIAPNYRARVVNPATGAMVEVTIIAAIPQRNGSVIDLSRDAAMALGMPFGGHVVVSPPLPSPVSPPELERVAAATELAAQAASLAAREADLSAQAMGLAAREAEIAARETDVAAREAEIPALAAGLAARAAELAAHAADLSAQAEELAYHATSLAAREVDLDALADVIVAREADLDALAASLAAREADLDARAANLALREAGLNALASSLAAREADLEDMAASLAAHAAGAPIEPRFHGVVEQAWPNHPVSITIHNYVIIPDFLLSERFDPQALGADGPQFAPAPHVNGAQVTAPLSMPMPLHGEPAPLSLPVLPLHDPLPFVPPSLGDPSPMLQPIMSPPLAAFDLPLNGVAVIPGLPDPRSGRVYRLQIGAYSGVGSSSISVGRAEAAGFNVQMERYGGLFRVLVVDIPSWNVQAAVQRLAALGYAQIWVRE